MSSPFKDKSVAIVGNGPIYDIVANRSIEDHDVVVLMNSGLSRWNVRCDVYCYSGTAFAPVEGIPNYYMSTKHRDQVPEGVEFYDEAKWHILYNTLLGARPTTGLMVIDMVRAAKPKSIKLYGFDFFETGDCAAVHCPSSEKRLVEEWGLL